jgi:predicted DCC family thiol-disulfide oxidoreductase YuxK
VPPTRIVFYDGHCALCNGTVRWLLRLDRKRVLHYAPLQGQTAQRLLGPQAVELDAIVYWREGKPTAHASDAVAAILGDLAWPWSWGRVLAWVPRGLREWGYRGVARWRYRVFGRYEVCPVPKEEDRSRFLT